eukprot:COSAG03_NODE_1235_length_4502_cov_2.986373_1_plen_339_part_10
MSALSTLGAVGLPPPDLQGYSDPQPTYTVGIAIAPNKPLGPLSIGKHGLCFDAPGLPGGLMLDAATGILSGTPTVATEPRAPTLVVTARDHGGIATAHLRLTVRPLQKRSVAEFKPTGAIVDWTVPDGVGSAVIEAWGAQGGGRKGGLGAHLRGTFVVTGGEVLRLLVGDTPSPGRNSSGGGGGSFVVRKAGTAPLLIAGGGGGGDPGLDAALAEAGVTGQHKDLSQERKGGTGGRDGAGGGGDGYYSNGANHCGGSGGGLLGNGMPATDFIEPGVGRAFVNGGNGGKQTKNYHGVGGFGGGGAGGSNGHGGGGGYSGGGGGAFNGCGGGGGGSLNKGA